MIAVVNKKYQNQNDVDQHQVKLVQDTMKIGMVIKFQITKGANYYEL